MPKVAVAEQLQQRDWPANDFGVKYKWFRTQCLPSEIMVVVGENWAVPVLSQSSGDVMADEVRASRSQCYSD